MSTESTPETRILNITNKIFKLLFKLDQNSCTMKNQYYLDLLENNQQVDISLEEIWNTKIQFKKEFGSTSPNIEFSNESNSEISLTFFIGKLGLFCLVWSADMKWTQR